MSRPLASSTMETVFTFSRIFFTRKTPPSIITAAMIRIPSVRRSFRKKYILLQLLFSFPYFSFHNSESFPVHLAKIIQGMTGKFKMSRAVLEIQFLDLEKGRNLFS